MANTNTAPDFSVIWAEKSPIGLYNLTDDQIQEGWNFIKDVPPDRTMFDAWMNRADKKMKWMYDNMFSADSMAGYLFWRFKNSPYFVGEKVSLQKEYPTVYLECTVAGTTADEDMLNLPEGKKAGDVFTDGTVQWVVRQNASTAYVDNSISTAVGNHNNLATAHANFDWVKSLSAASDGLHFRTRNANADTVLNLINTLQAALTQDTVPTGNNGTILALLSGIVHQIKSITGKPNWWETPKDSFESLSAGIVAGDVSNVNSWWVKLGGAIPLIIQGGTINVAFREGNAYTFAFPIAFSTITAGLFTTINAAGASSGTLGAYIGSYSLSSCNIHADEGGWRPTCPVFVLAFGQ